MSDVSKRVTYLFLASAIVLFAYFIGLKGTTQDTIRRDETTTMGHIGAMERDGNVLSIPGTWDSLLSYSGEHPPLYYTAANAWGKMISYDYRIQRILSLFWGILTVAVVYRIAADVASPQAGLWSIAILSTFVLYHHYLHEIREYSTLMFWAAAVWLVYLRCANQREPSGRLLLALGIATAGAVYSHPTSMFLFLTMGLYHLFFVPKTKAWWKISIAIVLGGATYILWLPGLSAGLVTVNSRLAEGEGKTLYNPILIQEVIQFWGNGQVILFLLIVLAAFGAAIRNAPGSRKIWFFMIGVALAILALNSFFPFIKRLRYVLVFILPYAVLAGIGLTFVARRVRGGVILPTILLIVWIGVGTNFYKTMTYSDAVGNTALETFTEYHALMPLLEEITEPGISLVNVVYNLAIIRDSKQGKMGIDEYYNNQFDIRGFSIRWDINNNEQTEQAVDFVHDESDFWLNYFHTAVLAQVRDFREAVEAEFKVCREYQYGEKSILVHYVAIDRYDELCDSRRS